MGNGGMIYKREEVQAKQEETQITMQQKLQNTEYGKILKDLNKDYKKGKATEGGYKAMGGLLSSKQLNPDQRALLLSMAHEFGNWALYKDDFELSRNFFKLIIDETEIVFEKRYTNDSKFLYLKAYQTEAEKETDLDKRMDLLRYWKNASKGFDSRIMYLRASKDFLNEYKKQFNEDKIKSVENFYEIAYTDLKDYDSIRVLFKENPNQLVKLSYSGLYDVATYLVDKMEEFSKDSSKFENNYKDVLDMILNIHSMSGLVSKFNGLTFLEDNNADKFRRRFNDAWEKLDNSEQENIKKHFEQKIKNQTSTQIKNKYQDLYDGFFKDGFRINGKTITFKTKMEKSKELKEKKAQEAIESRMKGYNTATGILFSKWLVPVNALLNTENTGYFVEITDQNKGDYSYTKTMLAINTSPLLSEENKKAALEILEIIDDRITKLSKVMHNSIITSKFENLKPILLELNDMDRRSTDFAFESNRNPSLRALADEFKKKYVLK